jgi:hypothetical protein
MRISFSSGEKGAETTLELELDDDDEPIMRSDSGWSNGFAAAALLEELLALLLELLLAYSPLLGLKYVS